MQEQEYDMKKSKLMTMLLSLILVAALSGGCQLIFNSNVDVDLEDLAAFSTGLDTAVRMLALDKDLSTGSRTVNYDATAVDSPIKNTPDATYAANGGNVSNEINIPGGNSVITDFYGTNPAISARFSMRPEGDNGYRIKLYVYDAGDFMLDYVYEEYYVTGGSWGNLAADWATTGYIDYYDNMHDGAKVEHANYRFGPVAADNGNVYAIVADDILTNLTDYQFGLDTYSDPSLFTDATDLPEPTIAVPGGFYSYKESTGNFRADEASRKAPNRPDYESITYYAERNNQAERNMVVFMLQSVEKAKKLYAQTVTRYNETYDASETPMALEEKQLNSLTTFVNDKGNTRQRVVKEIEQRVSVTGLTEITHSEKLFEQGTDFSESPDKVTVMELTQDEAVENDFTGTMSITQGSKVTNYTVTYNGTKFKTRKSRGSRAVETIDLEVDLAQLSGGGEFTLNLDGGSLFEGTYYQGRLTGTIRYPNGDFKRIDIVNGVVFLNDEVWRPGS